VVSNYEPFLRRALQGEAITGVEVPRPSRRPGQPDMITMASYQPAWDEAGEVIGISIAVADISDINVPMRQFARLKTLSGLSQT